MHVFRFTGRRHGETVAGELKLASSDAVATHLMGTGITPIEIVEVSEGDDALAFLRAQLVRGRVDLEDLIILSRQMYTMIRAGIPIVRTTRAIAEGTGSQPLARV